jgi:putative transposon-encoded protein
MKSVKKLKLKRSSTRHVSEVTAIAGDFGNSPKIIVPKSWLGRRMIAFLHGQGRPAEEAV